MLEKLLEKTTRSFRDTALQKCSSVIKNPLLLIADFKSIAKFLQQFLREI